MRYTDVILVILNGLMIDYQIVTKKNLTIYVAAFVPKGTKGL